MKNQSSYLILLFSILLGFNLQGQGTTCSSAVPALIGVNSADGPSTGNYVENACGFANAGTNSDWYEYIPTNSTSVTIESCLQGVDTRVAVYSGTCSNLTCIESNDDYCEMTADGDLFASSVTFPATAGVSYFIQWDDRWDNGGFDWTLSEEAQECPVLGLNIGDSCNLGGSDGIVSDNCLCVNITIPDCATSISPVDGAIDVPIDITNSNAVSLSWSLNGFQPNDGVNIYWGSDPTQLTFLGTASVGSTSISVTGVVPGVYYWQAIPMNSLGEAANCDIFIFTTADFGPTMAVPDCPIPTIPSDGALVPNIDSLELRWDNIIGEFSADQNVVYLGIDPGTLQLVGLTLPATDSLNYHGIEQGQTYFWTVIPSNAAGAAIGCQISSFTVDGALDCPDLGLNIGNPCDDENTNTINDIVQADCVCLGTLNVQNVDCLNAEEISEGIHFNNQIGGGNGASNLCFTEGTATNSIWFSFVANCDGSAIVSSAIDLDNPDTRSRQICLLWRHPIVLIAY